MRKVFHVEGMACNHCRTAIEKALNSIEGVKADVTLDPPVAVIHFGSEVIPTEKLQEIISEEGDYKLYE